MLLLVCTGIVLDNSCLGYTDSLTGSLLLTGTAFFLLSQHELESAPRCRNLIFAVLAGIALGMCSAVKYSGLVLAPLITLMLPLLFTQKIFRSTGLKKCFLRYSLSAGAAIITAGAFYLPNFIKTGNPFYPVKIPFIFGNGIDFERPPVAFKQLWSFFINDSQWSMNTAMALLYTALYLATALLLVFKFNKKCRQNHLIGMCMILGLIFLIAEIVMLAIYPAMTQARSIIPFLMVSALLFAPVLAVVLPEPPANKKSVAIYMIILLAVASLTGSCNYFTSYKIIAAIVIAGALLLGLIKKTSVYRSIMIFFVSAGTAILFWCCYFRWAVADDLNQTLYGDTVHKTVNAVRSEYKNNHYRPVKIASSGVWFNYLLMLDMPGNSVEHVPINKAATTHPHEVSDISELRTPVSSSEWIKRLKDGRFDWLLIDLESYQDFPGRRDQELQWALEHPETFELRVHSSHVYLFKIKY